MPTVTVRLEPGVCPRTCAFIGPSCVGKVGRFCSRSVPIPLISEAEALRPCASNARSTRASATSRATSISPVSSTSLSSSAISNHVDTTFQASGTRGMGIVSYPVVNVFLSYPVAAPSGGTLHYVKLSELKMPVAAQEQARRSVSAQESLASMGSESG